MESKRGSFLPLLNAISTYRVEWVFTAFIFLLLTAFVISFVRQEHLIYFWDSSAYWLKYKNLADLIRDSPLQALHSVISTIRNHEYNLLPVSLLIPAGTVLGVTRIGYLLNITFLYCFPVILIFAWFFKAHIPATASGTAQRRAFLLAVVCLGLSPQLWVPVLSGYLDAGGLIPAMIVLIAYFSKPLISRNYSAILIMAFLLCLMVLFRRWYAYWVAGFLFSVAIDSIRHLAASPGIQPRDYPAALARPAALAIGSVVLFFVCATPIATTMLLTDYGDIYSGYKYSGSMYEFFLTFQAYFGPMTVWGAGLGVVMALWNRTTRVTAMVLFLQFWFSLLLFNATQNMGPNHYYILLPSLYFFLCFSAFKVLEALQTRLTKTLACLSGVILLATNFAIVFIPAMTTPLQNAGAAFPQLRLYPKQRQDIEEIHRLLSYLEKLTHSGSQQIYVLASGHTLNDDILRNACALATTPYSICNQFATVAHVDRRDGLPVNLFQSRYVVTTDPAEFHLFKTEDQQVIGRLRSMLIEQEGFGADYAQLDAEFVLDNTVKVHIYQRRDKPFEADALQAVSDFFVNLYPEHREKFQFPQEVFSRLTEQGPEPP